MGFLIGISGKARTGKDTFAQMLAEELQKETGQAYILMAYANELKLKIQRDFDLSYEQLWGDEKEIPDKRYIRIKAELSPSVKVYGGKPEKDIYWTSREIMQSYGQFFREIDYHFWVKYLFRVIEEKEYKNVIITDSRHINEVDAIVDRGGYHIRVERDTKDYRVHNTQHISETALDSAHRIDFKVSNNGTLDELRNRVKDVVRFLISSEKMVNKLSKKEIKNGSKK